MFIRRVAGFAAAGLAVLTCALGTTSVAHADPAFGSAVWGGIDSQICAAPEGSFNFLNNGTCLYTLTQAAPGATGVRSDGATGSSAAAQAQLAQGSVSVAVSGTTFVPNVGNGSAHAHALIWDTLVFSGAAPGATATITMTGTSSVQGDARIAAVAVLFDLSQVGAIGSPPSLLEGNNSSQIAGQPTYSYQQTFGIYNDTPMLFAIGVSAFAGVSDGSVPGSASITDPFTIDLPTGVTFTSASQLASAVPEPASLLLIATGLAGLGWSRGKRHG